MPRPARTIAITLIAGSAIAAGCALSANPDHLAYTQAKVAKEIAGRTALKGQRCLGAARRESARGVGDAIFFGAGKTIYKMETSGLCSGLDGGQNILVTEPLIGGDLCRGDTARVVDTYSHIPISTCFVEGFTPYVRN